MYLLEQLTVQNFMIYLTSTFSHCHSLTLLVVDLRLYLGVLEDELGITRGALPGVSDEALLQAFGKSMKKRSRELPCFGAQVMSSEEWWAGVVRTTFKGAGVRESNLDSVFDRVFQRLRGDFAGKTAWELLPVSGYGINACHRCDFCRGNKTATFELWVI